MLRNGKGKQPKAALTTPGTDDGKWLTGLKLGNTNEGEILLLIICH